MPASTWTWKGGSGPSSVASNWTLTAGAGNANGIPQPGDLAILPTGIITDGLAELAGQGALDIIIPARSPSSRRATGSRSVAPPRHRGG